MGNANQYTPWGNITYTDSSNGVYDPNQAPKFTTTVTLSPEQQQLLDSQQRSDLALANLGEQQIGRIANAVSTPYSYSGLGDAPSQEDIATASQRAEDAIYSRLNPQFQRDEESLRTRLINQGIGQGSDAYNKEFESLNQAKNDARMQAILQGANYGGQLQNQAMARRNQGIQEYNAQRNAPLNEFTALTSGQQIQAPTSQNFSSSAINPVDMAGLVNQQYQNSLNAYSNKIAQQNANQGALFGLGTSALLAPVTGGGSFLGNMLGRIF